MSLRSAVVGAILAAATAVGALGAAPSVSAATYDVGQHLHVAILNAPSESAPIARAPYTFHVDVKLHNYPTKTKYLRIDRDGGTTTNTLPLVLGPGADINDAFDWTINFASWSVGRHEIRFHLEVPDTGAVNLHKRQFTTSRYQICIVSCTPSYRKGPFLGGGSWYGAYMVPLIVSDRAKTVVPGGIVTIKSQYADVQLCAFLNPDFHHGSHGTQLGCFAAGTGKHTISLAGAKVGDDLIILARGTQQAGVTHVKVGDTGPTFFFETQSWWSQTGLVLP